MEITVRQLNGSDSTIISEQMYRGCLLESDKIAELFADGVEKRKETEILFVTGNLNKVNELKQMMDVKHVTFKTLDIDLPEIQNAQMLNIVQDKCLRAFDHINSSSVEKNNDGNNDELANRNSFVLVEDTCLNFRALNGMPGPYVKWFMRAIGSEGLYRLLADFEDKSAEAVCIYALMDTNNKEQIMFFKGVAGGRITKPCGTSWGWDPIFLEERSGLTFGQMDAEMKSKFSHRANALTLLRRYLSIFEEKKD